MKAKWLIVVGVLVGCQKSEVVSVYTGNQSTYALIQVAQYPVNGTVTFKERKDGGTTILLQLKGTDGTDQLPVHLHMGDVSANGITIAALLNPLNAKTGVSETTITQLADNTKVTYRSLLSLAAYVNVHASSSGPESSVILVAGNIGTNGTKVSTNSRFGICSGK